MKDSEEERKVLINSIQLLNFVIQAILNVSIDHAQKIIGSKDYRLRFFFLSEIQRFLSN